MTRYSQHTLFKRSVARYRRLGRERDAATLEALGEERAGILRRLLGKNWLGAVTR